MTLIDTQKKKGFTLFIALIVTSILLAIGFSLGNIVLKQLLLSSSGQESEVAFYAADSASECALYWDRKDATGLSVTDSVFATSTDVSQAQSITCGHGYDGAGAVSSVTKIVSPDGTAATTTFYVNYDNLLDQGTNAPYQACARVDVAKNGLFTQIIARGYNAGYTSNNAAGTCDTSNARTVERGLQLNY